MFYEQVKELELISKVASYTKRVQSYSQGCALLRELLASNPRMGKARQGFLR